MSRLLSAAAILRGTLPRREKPREGTHIRRLYDLLTEASGEPVEITREDEPYRPALRDIWGLDIVCAGRGRWRLVGEFVQHGRVYVIR